MLTEQQRTRAQEVFLEYGPTPRLCINCVRNPAQLEFYHSRRNEALERLDIDTLLSAVRLGEELDMDTKQFHSIVLLKRQNAESEAVDDLHLFQHFSIEPITISVKQLLMKQLLKVEMKEQLRSYLLISKTHESRVVAGLIFEALAQRQLQEGVVLSLMPMVRVPPPVGKRNATWEKQSGTAAGAAKSIWFKPLYTTKYTPSTLEEEFQAGVLYIPTASIQVAFDSFILMEQILYIFQFTIAPSHDIKGGILDFFSQATLRDKLQDVEWRFVFVIEPRLNFVCPEANVQKMKWFWESAMLFTAEINVYQDRQWNPVNPKAATTPTPTRRALGKRKAEDVPPHDPHQRGVIF